MNSGDPVSVPHIKLQGRRYDKPILTALFDGETSSLSLSYSYVLYIYCFFCNFEFIFLFKILHLRFHLKYSLNAYLKLLQSVEAHT